MTSILGDLKYGWRMLAKSPAFTVVAALAIALGVAANTSIFSFVDAVIIRPLPYPHPDELAGLGQWRMLHGQYAQAGVSAPNIQDIEKQNHVFQEVGFYLWNSYNLTSGNPPERLEGAELSANMLKLIGIQPVIGRGFTRQETEPGHDREAILGYGLWQRQFGGKRSAIGKTIQLDEKPYTIIGVMPRNFYFIWDSTLDVITPLALPASEWSEAGRSSRDLQTMARLKAGVSIQRAQIELNTIASRLAAQYPDADKGWGIKVEPMHAAYHRQIATPLIVISSAAFLVLLIACVNVANLLLVRSTTRRKEIAVRIAMGASRRRLVSQLLTESVLLGCLGGVVGVLFSYAGVRVLASECKRYYVAIGVRWISLNGTVLVFCLGLAVLTGIVFGLVPALGASKLDVNEPLKESSGSVTAEAGRRRLRNGLVVCEVCLAMILLVGSGLLIHTFLNILNVDLGFDPHHVLEAYLPLPPYKYKTPAQQIELVRSALERIRALPGVKAACASLPNDYLLFNVEGASPPSAAQQPSAFLSDISPGFFRTLRTPLIEGRDFADADNAPAPRVAIINQTLAHRYFPNVNPLGHVLVPLSKVYGQQSKSAPKPLEIVGVVRDNKLYSGFREDVSEIFVPYAQYQMEEAVFDIRTALPASTMTRQYRGAIRSVDSSLPVEVARSLEHEIGREYGSVSFPYMIVWTFAALALILSTVGIFGVVSYSVSQRTHEIAIRMALGAQRQDVVRLILMEGLRLTGIGLAIGIAISLILGQLIRSVLFGVSSYDPLTLGGAALVMAAVAALACILPARRAAKVDPCSALRIE